MCLSIFLSQSPNRFSNYFLLVISYRKTINSEYNPFVTYKKKKVHQTNITQQPRTKQATISRLLFDLTSSVLFPWCSDYDAHLLCQQFKSRQKIFLLVFFHYFPFYINIPYTKLFCNIPFVFGLSCATLSVW